MIEQVLSTEINRKIVWVGDTYIINNENWIVINIDNRRKRITLSNNGKQMNISFMFVASFKKGTKK